MARLTPIPQVAASLPSARPARLSMAGIAAFTLVLALGGCATKAQHSGASGEQKKASTAAGRTGGPAGGSDSTSSLSAQPGGAGTTSSGTGADTSSAAAGGTSDATVAGGTSGAAAAGTSASSSSDSTGGAVASSSTDGAGGPGSLGGQSAEAARAEGGSSAEAAGAVAAGGVGRSGEQAGSAAGASGDNASGMPGSSGSAAAASGGEGVGQGEGGGQTAGAAAGASSAGGATAAGAIAGGPDARSGVGGGTAGMEGNAAGGGDADSRVAAIDVPNTNVKVDEDYRPQTLGGMLPLVLGVNEEGRFDFDQYALRGEVKSILDQLADKLKSADYDRLDIVGYTDRIGAPEYNQRLSELRAWSVAQYLMSKGVPDNKVHYEGRGRNEPLTRPDECTGLARDDLIACLQKDRRVEIEASIRRKHATITQ